MELIVMLGYTNVFDLFANIHPPVIYLINKLVVLVTICIESFLCYYLDIFITDNIFLLR